MKKLFILKIVLVAILLTGINGCDELIIGDPSLTVKGRVLEMNTNLPVENAKIIPTGRTEPFEPDSITARLSDSSDFNGSFHIAEIGGGAFIKNIMIYKKGYKPIIRTGYDYRISYNDELFLLEREK